MKCSININIVPITIIVAGVFILLGADFKRKPKPIDCPTVQLRADPRTYSFVELAMSQTYSNKFLNLLHKETEKGLSRADANEEAREKLAISVGFKDSFTALNYNLENAELQRKAAIYRLCQFHWDQYKREGDGITSLDFIYLKEAVENFEEKMHKIIKKCAHDHLENSSHTFVDKIKRMCRTKALVEMGVIRKLEE